MSFDNDTQWRARVFADKVLKMEVQKEIEKLALVLLGNNKLKISYSKEGFQTNHPKYERPMYYMGKWREWVVFGQTKTDLYLEVLKMLANDSSTYYPVVSYRRDDEWVEAEQYNNLNDKFKNEKNKVKTYEKELERLYDARYSEMSDIAKETFGLEDNNESK